jgi:hypothetical protein
MQMVMILIFGSTIEASIDVGVTAAATAVVAAIVAADPDVAVTADNSCVMVM